MQKVAEAGHKALRTRAMVSEKVGKGFSYQAAERTGILWPAGSRWAARVTQENSPKSTGVVRPMAKSDHCRWVSTPRWVRASWKVISSCQRKTNHSMIWTGSTTSSVHNSAYLLSLSKYIIEARLFDTIQGSRGFCCKCPLTLLFHTSGALLLAHNNPEKHRFST